MPKTDFHKRRLAERLKDPAFRDEYERAGREIAQVDAIMRELDARRIAVGLSKAELARHVGKQPASIRRLFSSEMKNPELKTVAALADALDADIALRPRRAPRRRRQGATTRGAGN